MFRVRVLRAKMCASNIASGVGVFGFRVVLFLLLLLLLLRSVALLVLFSCFLFTLSSFYVIFHFSCVFLVAGQ